MPSRGGKRSGGIPLRRVLADLKAKQRADRPIAGAGVSATVGPTGRTLSADQPPATVGVYWIRVTAAGTGLNSGLYAWTHILPDPASYGFTATATTGTVAVNPAVEANLSGGLTIPSNVPAYLYRGLPYFQLEMCGTGPPAPPPSPPPVAPTTSPSSSPGTMSGAGSMSGAGFAGGASPPKSPSPAAPPEPDTPPPALISAAPAAPTPPAPPVASDPARDVPTQTPTPTPRPTPAATSQPAGFGGSPQVGGGATPYIPGGP